MTVIRVKLKKRSDRTYDIVVAEGILNDFRPLLKGSPAGRYAVIADGNVGKIYGNDVVKRIGKTGNDATLIVFKAGESEKRLSVAEKILEKMVKLGFTRHDAVIALGGGVSGDLAGFIASVFMRGIPVIQVPTSLLAMVDAAIGGKTGVNLESGKNLTGTFHQPRKVIIDPLTLKTLPKEEFANGFAEIIKYGIIQDASLFRLLEKQSKNIQNLDGVLLNKIIARCAGIKASITEKDEEEKGLRMTLNYGHTAGHAIERYSNYKFNHGRSISLGMVIANNIGIISGVLKPQDSLRIKNLLNTYSLPVSPIQILPDKNSRKRLWTIMQKDKKMRKCKISFIIPDKIGSTVIYDRVTMDLFLKSFSVS